MILTKELIQEKIHNEEIYWMRSPSGSLTIGKIFQMDPELPLEVVFFGCGRPSQLSEFIGWDLVPVQIPEDRDSLIRLTDLFSVKFDGSDPVSIYRKGKPWMPITKGRLPYHLIKMISPV